MNKLNSLQHIFMITAIILIEIDPVIWWQSLLVSVLAGVFLAVSYLIFGMELIK